MNRNLFFIVMFSFSYIAASEVEQFFYGMKVAAIAVVITLGIQPVCGDTTTDNHQTAEKYSFCLNDQCSHGLVASTVFKKFEVSKKDILSNKFNDQNEFKKNEKAVSLPVSFYEQKCPADLKGSYNPGEKGYLLK